MYYVFFSGLALLVMSAFTASVMDSTNPYPWMVLAAVGTLLTLLAGKKIVHDSY